MTKKSGVKRKGSTKVNKKALKELISKGKEQGYLTYEEINVAFPEEALTQDQLDENETPDTLSGQDFFVEAEVSNLSPYLGGSNSTNSQ